MALSTVEFDPVKIFTNILGLESNSPDKELQKWADILSPHDNVSATFSQLQEICQKHDVVFIDTAFPPKENAIFTSPEKAFNVIIQWKRPPGPSWWNSVVYILQPLPTVAVGIFNANGLLSAVICLLDSPLILNQIFLDDLKAKNDFAIHKIRMCKSGEWIGVVVDEYLPFQSSGEPAYSRCNYTNNELFVPLMEKAYSKVHGSYQSIENIAALDIIMDLTGAPCKRLILPASDGSTLRDDDILWSYMTDSLRNKHILFCEAKSMEGSIFSPSFSYSIIACELSSSTSRRLCKIRNAFSSAISTSLLSPELKAEIEATQSDENFVWILFSDLNKYFVTMNQCLTQPSPLSGPGLISVAESGHGNVWTEFRHRLQMHFSESSLGVISVPIYSVQVPVDGCDLHFYLHQQDHRTPGARAYIDTGISVYREGTSSSTTHRELIAASGIGLARQVQVELSRVAAGTYLIVPTSGGGKIEQLKAQYLASGGAGAGNVAVPVDASLFTRSLVLSIHSSSSAIQVQELSFEQQLYEDAETQPVIKFGTSQPLSPPDQSVTLHTLKALDGTGGMSYVVQNSDIVYRRVCSVKFDPRASAENCISHRGSDLISACVGDIKVPPRSARLLHHIMAAEYDDPWAVDPAVTSTWLTPIAAVAWYAEDSRHLSSIAHTKREERHKISLIVQSSMSSLSSLSSGASSIPKISASTFLKPSNPNKLREQWLGLTATATDDSIASTILGDEAATVAATSAGARREGLSGALRSPANDLVPILGLCCLIATYAPSEVDEASNRRALASFSLCCLEFDMQLFKPLRATQEMISDGKVFTSVNPQFTTNVDDCIGCRLLDGSLIATDPTTLLKGTARVLCFDCRCAFPCDDEVPCVLNAVGCNLCLDGTVLPAAGSSIGEMRMCAVDPLSTIQTSMSTSTSTSISTAVTTCLSSGLSGSALLSPRPFQPPPIVGLGGELHMPDADIPLIPKCQCCRMPSQRLSSGITYSFKEVQDMSVDNLDSNVLPVDEVTPLYAVCCCIASLAARDPDLVVTPEYFSGFCNAVFCCMDLQIRFCLAIHQQDSVQIDGVMHDVRPRRCYMPCTIMTGALDFIEPYTVLKAAARLFVYDFVCAIPCEDDVPCLLTCCAFTMCYNMAYKPAMSATVDDLQRRKGQTIFEALSCLCVCCNMH